MGHRASVCGQGRAWVVVNGGGVSIVVAGDSKGLHGCGRGGCMQSRALGAAGCIERPRNRNNIIHTFCGRTEVLLGDWASIVVVVVVKGHERSGTATQSLLG